MRRSSSPSHHLRCFLLRSHTFRVGRIGTKRRFKILRFSFLLSLFTLICVVSATSTSKLNLVVSDTTQHLKLLSFNKILPEQITITPKNPYNQNSKVKKKPKKTRNEKEVRKVHVFDEFLVFEEPRCKDKVLLIRYSSVTGTDFSAENGTAIEVYQKDELPHRILSAKKTHDYEAIFGIYHFPSGPILALVTAAEDVFEGSPPSQSVDLQRASEIVLLPLSTASTTTAQGKKNPLSTVEGFALDLLRDAFYSHAFYFSRTEDATHTLQRRAEKQNQRELQSWKCADRRFFWNYHTTKDFQSINGASPWIVPMTSAFVQVERNCTAKLVKEDEGDKTNNTFDLMLISRRSAFRQGTRFTRRGIDGSGNVANFVESEQIMYCNNGQATSHVQIRGSIPVYWSSPTNLKYTPPVKIGTDKKERMDAFSLHVKELSKCYGEQGVIFLNLVDKKKDQQRLGKMFDRTVRKKLKYDRSSGNSTPLNHVWFDFHAETKGMQWGRLKKLVEQVQIDFDKEGFFHQAEDGTVLNKQSGVARTNCMDCLDRTNVVQALLGRRTLLQQLLATGIIDDLPELEIDENEDAEEAKEGIAGIHQMDMPFPKLEERFRDVWGNNADHISKLYAGTRALKGDYTRTGQRTKRGVLQDGYNSVRRYFINNFLDHDRQRAVDLLLGKVPPVSFELIQRKGLTDLDQWADLIDLEVPVKFDDDKNITSSNSSLVQSQSYAPPIPQEKGSIALGLHRLGMWGCAAAMLCIMLSFQRSKIIENFLFSYLPKAALLVLAFIGQGVKETQMAEDVNGSDAAKNG